MLDDGTAIDLYDPCCSWIRRICRGLALMFTLYVMADAYLVCLDLYGYATQPDPNGDYRGALIWVYFFVPALLETVAMLAFLLPLRPCAWYASLATSAGYGDGAERSDARSMRATGSGWQAKRRKLVNCVVLLLLSAHTAFLYSYVFNDPMYVLHHLAMHVFCIGVTLLWCIVFAVFTATFVFC